MRVQIRCSQLNPTIGQVERNLAVMAEEITAANAEGVQLLVLPELVTCGYNMSRTEVKEAALATDNPIFSKLASLITSELRVVFGFAEASEDTIYNSSMMISKEGIEAVYRKVHLWNSEKELFTPGHEQGPVVATPFGKIGLLICYDLEIPEFPRSIALQGADILALPVNWPLLERPSGEHPPEVIHAMAAARASGIAIACCDRSGEERGVKWTEGTTIVGTDGWIVSKFLNESRVDAEVFISPSRMNISERNHVFNDRFPSLYSLLTYSESH